MSILVVLESEGGQGGKASRHARWALRRRLRPWPAAGPHRGWPLSPVLCILVRFFLYAD